MLLLTYEHAEKTVDVLIVLGKDNMERIREYDHAQIIWSQMPFACAVVEDVKSKATKTAVYRIKRKLMAALYGIAISEIA